MVPLKIVSNVSRFKPALNLNGVLADLNRRSNSLNSISGLNKDGSREKDEEISKLQAIINSTIQEKDEIIATLKDQLEAALNQKKVVEISNPVKQSPAESPHKKKYKLVPDQRLRKIPKSKATIQKPAKSIVVQPRKSLRANLSTVGSLEYRASSALPQAVTVSNSNEKYINDSLGRELLDHFRRKTINYIFMSLALPTFKKSCFVCLLNIINNKVY